MTMICSCTGLEACIAQQKLKRETAVLRLVSSWPVTGVPGFTAFFGCCALGDAATVLESCCGSATGRASVAAPARWHVGGAPVVPGNVVTFRNV